MRHARFTVVVILVAGSFAARCPAQQRLSGRVITVDSTPVAGAVLQLRSLPDTFVVAGTVTDTLGCFEFFLTGVDDAASPHALRLEQNYPNPFSASTTFTFVLPSAGAVSLTVFDRMGRRVASLLSGFQSAGAHRVAWDGSGTDGAILPAGQYFVLLQTADGFRSRLAIRSSGGSASVAPAAVAPAAVRFAPAAAFRHFDPVSSYRLDVIDTVAALPRFKSRSLTLDVMQPDTTVTVVVEYGGWEDLGFPTTKAQKLFFDAPYLYVCAWQDGLWRRDVHSMSQWEYLGLADSSVNQGVTDVDARGSRLLVGYNGNTHTKYHPDSVVSVWRSTDAGGHWYAVDSTIRQRIAYQLGMNAISIVKRSPHQPGIVIAVVNTATGVFRSTDDGCTWTLIHGNTNYTFGSNDGWWNSTIPGVVYVQYGSPSGMARMTCYASYGDSLRFEMNRWFSDLAFPSFDTSHMYGTTDVLLCSSADTGRSWKEVVAKPYYLTFMTEHPYCDALIVWRTINDLDMVYPATGSHKRITKLPAPVSSDFMTDHPSRCVYFVCNSRVMRIRF